MSLDTKLIPGNLNFFNKEIKTAWGVREVLIQLIQLSPQFKFEGSWTGNDYSFILASATDTSYFYRKGDIALCYIRKDDENMFRYTKRLLYERTELLDESKALRFLGDQSYSMNGAEHSTFLRGELKKRLKNEGLSVLAKLEHVFDYIDQRYAHGGFANG